MSGSHENTARFHAIIPAGGSGTRLWPLSRRAHPKFLHPLPGPKSMIQETVDRLRPLTNIGNVLVVTGGAHAVEIGRQVPDLDREQIVIEPAARGTGPAIGLAVALIARRDPDAIVGSFAADHHVRHPEHFLADVTAAIEVASEGRLVTIGIEPEYPETGYGYIRVGEQLGTFAGRPAHRVEQFREKPDLETANEYLAEGGYLWNASMFVWRAGTLLEEMERLLPDLHASLKTIVDAWDTPEREETFAATWANIADVTIDHGILEHSERVAVVPSQMGWSDLGDWHSVGALQASDQDNNASVNSLILSEDSRGNLVYGNGRLVSLVGVQDLVVIDTEDALLVCERHSAQQVKSIVDKLKAQGRDDLL